MKIKFEWKQWIADEKIKYAGFFLLLGLLSWLWQNFDSSKPITESAHNQPVEIDELLTVEQTAAPVELSNADSLSAIIGNTAWVDLFTTDPQTYKPKRKIAARVKIARAPKDPERFFIIVRENELNQILKFEGPYFATLQSRRRRDTSLINNMKSLQTTIQIREQL